MSKTWLIGASMVLGVALALTACNNGGGGGNNNNGNNLAANGILNTNGSLVRFQGGRYVGVISASTATIATQNYNYLMQILNMDVVSQNFQVTIETNGVVPGVANIIIQPMHQNRYSQGQVPGLNDQAETASSGAANGFVLAWYSPENAGGCQAGQTCQVRQPDIQIAATATTTAPNAASSCGGGYGARSALSVNLRVAGVIIGSGVLCGNGNTFNAGYNQGWNGGWNNGWNNGYQQNVWRPGYWPGWR